MGNKPAGNPPPINRYPIGTVFVTEVVYRGQIIHGPPVDYLTACEQADALCHEYRRPTRILRVKTTFEEEFRKEPSTKQSGRTKK